MSTLDVASDIELWMSWKRVTEVVRSAILGDVTEHSSLNEPELTVLVQLDRAGGMLRQNALAAAVGWDRTRLSHLLTRMEERGHIRRDRLRLGVEVMMLEPGRLALESTRGPLAAAVARHITRRLTAQQRDALLDITHALSGTDSTATRPPTPNETNA